MIILHIYFLFFIFSGLFNTTYLVSVLEKLTENYKTDKYFSLAIAFIIFWLILCIPISLATTFLWILNTKNKIKLWYLIRKNNKKLKSLNWK